jgi:hypothetical protein
LRSSKTRKQFFLRPTEAIPEAIRQKGKTHFEAPPLAVTTPRVGYFSLFANTTGSFNTAVGAGALDLNTGDNNTATGAAALLLNTTGSHNTANGAFALFANTTSSFNTAGGDNALFSNTIGTENTAHGAFAMSANTEGSFNTAIGVGALNMNTTGAGNTAIGEGAGSNITGDGNVCIGELVIGAAGLNDTTWIRNINTTPQRFIANTNNYVTVRMTDGRLGFTTIVSSRRYKEDIKPMDKASEALLALKPVTFRLKGEFDPSHRPQWGLIAEEVEKVNLDLVDRNNKGEVGSVRYDMVNAMLLNEFLKEHRKVEQQAMIGRLETAAGKAGSDNHRTEIHGGPAAERIADCYGASRRTGSPNPKGERATRRSESLRWRT